MVTAGPTHACCHPWLGVHAPPISKTQAEIGSDRGRTATRFLQQPSPQVSYSYSLTLLMYSVNLLMFSSCCSRASRTMPMGVLFSPIPSILFSSLFLRFLSRSDAWMNINSKGKVMPNTKTMTPPNMEMRK